jgi:hypothetical protein
MKANMSENRLVIILKDISRTYPELVIAELRKWKLNTKEVLQVYKLAGKVLSI